MYFSTIRLTIRAFRITPSVGGCACPEKEKSKFPKKGKKRPEKINAIELYLKGDMTPGEQKIWEDTFEVVPDPLTDQDRRDWLESLDQIALSSDAFIPFRDNIDRAARSGVKYVIQTAGSIQDDNVIAAADEYGRPAGGGGDDLEDELHDRLWRRAAEV